MMKRKETIEGYDNTLEDAEEPKTVTNNPNFFMAFRDKRLSITCGNLKRDVPFILWDSIPMCDIAKCSIGAVCPNAAKSEGRKCTIQTKYIKNVYGWLVDAVADNVDTITMMDIGLQLMPLYGQLIKMKILETSLEHNLTEQTKSGIKIHPVYREIRSIMGQISEVQARLLCRPAEGPEPINVRDLGRGDPDYADELIRAGKERGGPKPIAEAFDIKSGM